MTDDAIAKHITEGEAWNRFCSWQAAAEDARLIRIQFEATETHPVRVVYCEEDERGSVCGDTLSECWEKFGVTL